MRVEPQRLEVAILKAIAQTRDGEWWQCGYADLYNRMREIDSDAANEDMTIVMDALISLAERNLIRLEKFSDTAIRAPFDLSKQNSDSYRRQFFGYDRFELRLTHAGRTRISEPTNQTESDSRKTNQNARTYAGGFGTYSIGNSIGQGGAGVVFEARDDQGAPCALKIVNSPSSVLTKRFRNEIGFCFRNKHPHIISVMDFGQAPSGKPFYVMPLYSSTLRKLMRSAAIPPAKILDLFAQILEGIEAAHQEDVCHRDLKPENILYEEATNQLVIADFGIARFKEEDLLTTVETSPHDKLANFVYAAPEQRIKGASVDQRADIYALALILNEMFTGQVLQGVGFIQITSVAPQYAYLDDAVHSMAQQDPNNRPASIQEIRKLLSIDGPKTSPSRSANSQSYVLPPGLSAQDRDRIFAEADVDFEILQGMAQNFIVSFKNKSDAKFTVRNLRLSFNRIRILEWSYRDHPEKPWEVEAQSPRQFHWSPNSDPVGNLMQLRKEWKQPFEAVLDVFIQIEVLGKIKTFDDRSIQVRVEPGARRIWHSP